MEVESGVECPDCGFVAQSNAGIGQHWSNQHEGPCPITKIDKVCEECGDEFRVKKSFEHRKFCSIECNAKHQSKDKVVKNCERCESEFEVHQFRYETARFCSHDCRHKWLADGGMPKGKDNPNWQGGKKKFECDWCGDSTYRHGKVDSDNQFCSMECLGEYRSKYQTGENAPNWSGGYEYRYGSNWTRQRRLAKERDGHTCQICGLDESDYYRELDVHHIIPAREFDQVEKANYLDNLITVCQTCHAKWEGIPLRPQRGD